MKRDHSIGIIAHSPRTVRIALGDRALEAGGAELQLAWIARLLRERDWRVSLIMPVTDEQAPLGEVDGFQVIPAHQPGRGSGWRNYVRHTVPAYWRALDAADASLYLHRGANGLAGWTAMYCQARRRLPVLSAASNLDVAPDLESGEARPSRLNRALYRHFLNHCGLVLAQSHEQATLYADRTGKRAEVIPNVAEVPAQVTPKSPRPLVAWAGAIRACKRPLWVLEIARALPEVEFRIAGGPNPGEEDLWTELQQGALDLPNVTLLGWIGVAEVEQLFGEAWVALCTSQMEGFPNVYLMAWGQATPLVTSFPAGGLAEASGAGLVADTPAAIAQAVRGLVANDDHRRTMGSLGRQYTLDHHGPQAVGDRYDRVLGELLGSART